MNEKKTGPIYNRPIIYSLFSKEKMGRIERLFLRSKYASFFLTMLEAVS
jgi:hypothetical protein